MIARPEKIEREEIERALGDTIASARGASGGDINEAYVLELTSGRRAFVKRNARAASDMFEREAEGLAWLREAGALRIPEVLASGPTCSRSSTSRSARRATATPSGSAAGSPRCTRTARIASADRTTITLAGSHRATARLRPGRASTRRSA